MFSHKEKCAFIQHDWEKWDQPGEQNPKFFFGANVLEKHCKARIKSLQEVETDQPGIKIELDKKTVKIQFPDFEATFLCPDLTISNPRNETSLKAVDVNCTGNMLAYADSKGNFAVMNSKTAAELRNFTGLGHILDVYRCRFFPSGLVVLSAGMDLSVRVWSVELGECVRTFKGHTQAVNDVAILGVGKEVLSCSKDGSVIKWSCGEDKEVKRWNLGSGPCNALCIGADHISTWFAVACESNRVFIMDANESEICNFAVDGCPTTLAFDTQAEGQILYVGNEDGVVCAYDIEKRETVYRLTTSRGTVTRIIAHKEGIIVSYYNGTCALYPRNFEVNLSALEFSGCDIDPIYDMSVHEDTLWTACRDNCFRKYTIPILEKEKKESIQ